MICRAVFHKVKPPPPCSGKEAIPAREIRRINSWRKTRDAYILKLRELGWTDRDMVDAMIQGAIMADHAVMMRVFDMDPNCLL
ncbi:hypothetical protein [Desulfobacter curvatus]|uniref:hypothetical protein n=1 Tax=Desulfobacter curvatus TaxID=2290 RepID=UPI000368314F|nr:hypothetical protein [Desulfobacter curvatus]